MKLSNINIDQLSGPTSFVVLEPADIMKEIKAYIPPLVMIGDVHRERTSLCENDKFSTYTSLWFRILDTLSSEDFGVFYNVEAFIPDQFLFTDYYFTDSRSKWFVNTPIDTVMNYSTRFMKECFAQENWEKKEKDKNPIDKKFIDRKCITSNIRYNFVDLRIGTRFLLFNGKDRDYILRSTISNVFEHQKIRSPKRTQISSQARQENVYQKTYEIYESILSTTFREALTGKRSHNIDHSGNILGYSILDLLILVYTDPKKLANILFDPKNSLIKKTSRLYQEASRHNINLCKKLFDEYFLMIIEDDEEIKVVKDKIMEGIKYYGKETKELKFLYDKYRKANTSKEELTDEEYYLYVKPHEDKLDEFKDYLKSEYFEACKAIAKTILIPFVDLFSLFKSFNHKNLITVYNCGEAHSIYFTKFLKKKLFHLTYESKRLNTQCVQINFNFDQFLESYIEIWKHRLPESKVEAFYRKIELSKRRYDILGEKVYLEMLNGKMISSHDYSQEDIEKLELSHVDNLVPSEYSNKLIFSLHE